MAIVSGCPNCKQRVSVADQHAGKQVRCPKCQQVFPIPAASAALASSAIQPKPPPVPPAPDVVPPKPMTPRRESPPPSSRRRRTLASEAGGRTPLFWAAIACGVVFLLLLGGGLLAIVGWLFLAPTPTANKGNPGDQVVVQDAPAAAKQAAKGTEVPPPANSAQAEVKSEKKPPKHQDPPQAKKAPIINAALADGIFEVQSQLGPSDFDDPIRQAWSKTYQVSVQAGGKYSIELVSNDFGAYVILENPTAFEIAEDFDKGSKHQARVEFTPAVSGPHRVIVTTVGRGRGDFTLTIRDLRTNPAKDG